MPYKYKQDKLDNAKKYYTKNTKLVLQQKLQNKSRARHRNREFVRLKKELGACADCGGKFHFTAMEYDHCVGDKAHNVSALAGNDASIKKIEEEIAKCELVCANCHRVRTYDRLMDKDRLI